MSDDPKWLNNPENVQECDAVLKGKVCLVCGSPLLVPFFRPPINVYKAHCNHCASEIPITVMLNPEAWKV